MYANSVDVTFTTLDRNFESAQPNVYVKVFVGPRAAKS